MLHFTPLRMQRRSSFSPKKPVLKGIILAEDSPSDSGDENAMEKPPPTNVSRGSRTASVLKDNHRLPRATKSASGLGDLELEPERKAFKKKAVLAVSASTISKHTRWSSFCEGRNSRGLDNSIRPCWKCFSSSRPYWSNSRKGVAAYEILSLTAMTRRSPLPFADVQPRCAR
ncbi:hypothetical protein HPB50_029204 [Hyalomma asiaticum]|nr:hypothetical protein HPB50_029204 [Hyalomma asiaticum]